jgi:hypothetical protein
MKKKYYIILVALIAVIVFFQLNRIVIHRPENLIPKDELNLKLETKDSRHDGKIDNWFYRDQSGVPVKWLRDSIHAGRPDKWSFFQNGKAFIDEEDIDHDGKVDVIYLTIWDSQGIKQRGLSFKVQDNTSNVLFLHEDTGRQPKDEIKTNTGR